MTPRQNKAIQALMTQPTKAEAAKAAGISPATLRRYLADEEFKREYNKALSELVKEAATQARQHLAPALQCLRDIVDDETKPCTARVQASRALIDYGLQLISFADIEEQIEELRRIADGMC